MHLIYNDVFDTIEKNSVIQKHPDKIAHILECALEELRENDNEEFEKLLIKLHKIAYEGKFSETLARHAVKHMENNDPKHLKGEYFSEHDVAEVSKKYGISSYNTDPWGVYYVLNMVRSDYFNPELPEDEEEKYYAFLAKNFIDDKDAVENKPFCYWMYIAKGY